MKNIVYFSILTIALFGCTSKERKIESEIAKSGPAFYELKSTDSLYSKAISFAEEFPKNKISAKVLITSSNYFFKKEMIAKALKGFELYCKNYPDSGGMYDALLNAGFIYDRMGNGPKAVEYWNKFIARFPEDPMSESIKQAIPHAGLPADEILKKFEEPSDEPVDGAPVEQN